MYFRFGSSNIPHFQKRYKGGEDAWLAQEDLLVVADGVGGWEEHGIDSGKFSKQLVRNVREVYEASPFKELKQILIDSVRKTDEIGSSTIVMAKFDMVRGNYIKTTNLGDSGYWIFRPHSGIPRILDAIYKSESQQYSFNFPYQCGTSGDGSPEQKNLGTEAIDNSHEVQDYDIIVMASDGVWDNLYERDIINCLKDQMPKSKTTGGTFRKKKTNNI